MQDSNSYETNTYHIISFKVAGRVRYIFRDKQSFVPSVAMSLYETRLAMKTRSHNTVSKDLSDMAYLYTWATQNEIDVDTLLLTGRNLKPAQIRTFSFWLSNQISRRGKKLATKTYNGILYGCGVVVAHFMEQYGEFGDCDGETGLQAEQRKAAIEGVKAIWCCEKKKTRKKPMAGDLSEDEIKAINLFLKPQAERLVDADPITVRDYLCWRLVIEFGLRAGELLALRLEDCPNRGQDFLRIERIEERGASYKDPRSNPPRPKTLSRDLGFLLADSQIPRVLSEYISRCRTRRINKHGRRKISHVMDDHPFLICATDSGEPLTVAGFEKIADKIRKGTGIENFHWHLGRHAFFNRAWSAVADNPEYKERKMDLVYWGGWENEDSLYLYINRARSKRVKQVMKTWVAGTNKWDALQ